jgi:hypothetical protein
VSAVDSSTATNYTSQAFLYGVTLALRPVDKFSTALSFQQIRSFAEFDPVYRSYGFDDTVGVKELSWLKTVENTVSFSGNYQLHKNISCGVNYNFREFTDERNNQYNGSVHSAIASMTAKW